MAYGNPGNPGGGGGEDYLTDESSGTAPKPEGEEEHAKGETAIVPKSLMAGKDFKVGEEIVFKIVAIHENDFEVEYSYDEKGEKGEEGAPPEMPAEMAGAGAGGGGMASMME